MRQWYTVYWITNHLQDTKHKHKPCPLYQSSSTPLLLRFICLLKKKTHRLNYICTKYRIAKTYHYNLKDPIFHTDSVQIIEIFKKQCSKQNQNKSYLIFSLVFRFIGLSNLSHPLLHTGQTASGPPVLTEQLGLCDVIKAAVEGALVVTNLLVHTGVVSMAYNKQHS